MSCAFRFHGDGWETRFFDRGELFYGRGGFVTRALAVQFAKKERRVLVGEEAHPDPISDEASSSMPLLIHLNLNAGTHRMTKTSEASRRFQRALISQLAR
jgi:hypothetical protein